MIQPSAVVPSRPDWRRTEVHEEGSTSDPPTALWSRASLPDNHKSGDVERRLCFTSSSAWFHQTVIMTVLKWPFLTLWLHFFGLQARAATIFAASSEEFVYVLKVSDTDPLKLQNFAQYSGYGVNWMTYEADRRLVWLLGQTHENQGKLYSYQVLNNGSLRRQVDLTIASQPMQSKFHNNGTAVSIVHCSDTVGLTVADISSNGAVTRTQQIKLGMDTASTVPDTSPGIPTVINAQGINLDPSGRFVVVLDATANLVRVFVSDPNAARLDPGDTYVLPPQTSAQRGIFSRPPPADDASAKLYLYVLGQKSILIFEVLSWPQSMTLVLRGHVPTKSRDGIGDIVLSEDGRFLLVSNPGDFATDDPESDSLDVYQLTEGGQTLRPLRTWSAGGRYPRRLQFLHGNRLVVALRSRVAILPWNAATGELGKVVETWDALNQADMVAVMTDEADFQ